MITKEKEGIKSESGRRLGGRYKSKKAATRRLAQIEQLKNHPKKG